MNSIVRKIWKIVKHYDHEKYWKKRENIQNSDGGGPIKRLLDVYYIKKVDAYHNASTGIVLEGKGSAFFETKPILPHGLNGIIIAQGTKFGRNCTIFHQVTIGCDNIDVDNVPTIGDNVTIYPGAKLFGKIHIGNGVKIGPNAVVYFDVADGETVVSGKAYLLSKK